MAINRNGNRPPETLCGPVKNGGGLLALTGPICQKSAASHRLLP
jgi:hypothetical protein